MLRPLDDRVLIRPLQPDQPSTLILTDTAPEVCGEVVSVGRGPDTTVKRIHAVLTALQDEAGSLPKANHADIGGGCVRLSDVRNLLDTARARLEPAHLVAPGDVVLFSATAGNEADLDGERLLILREGDLLATLED